MATPWRLAVDDFNVGHDMLGSEQLTELLLRGAEVTPLDGGDRTALSTVGAVISSVTRSEDTRRLTIALQLPHADAGWWLRVPSVDGTVWTVALPWDLEAVTYLLDLHTEFPPGDGRVRSLTHMDAALALKGNGFLTQAAAAWWAYDTQSTGAAVELVDEQHLIELLLHKVRSPLGATIAAHLLLEVRSHRIPRQWLQNLTDWFDRPDPPVLLAEHALREHDDSSWLDALELVEQRGLPHLSADVARLDAHVSELGRRDDLPGAAGLRSALAVPLAEAIARLRPGGLFATYFGDMDELDVRFLKPFR